MSNHSEDIKPISISSNDGYLPSPRTTPIKRTKRSRASSSPTPTPSPKKKGRRGRPASSTTGSKGQHDDGNRKTGSWTKKEVGDLWNAMGLLPVGYFLFMFLWWSLNYHRPNSQVKVRWEEIAQKVEGRDKLSCSNKWRYDMLPKIQAFIDSLGD